MASTAMAGTIWFWNEAGVAATTSLVTDIYRTTIHYLVRCLSFVTF